MTRPRLLMADEGQDLIEYALLIVFIAVAAVSAVMALGTPVNQLYVVIVAGLP